jgi:hypothetical protein
MEDLQATDGAASGGAADAGSSHKHEQLQPPALQKLHPAHSPPLLGTDSSGASPGFAAGSGGQALSSSQETAERQDCRPAAGLEQQQQQQQTPAQLSFTSEVYAVLHVQLMTGADGGADGGFDQGRVGSTLFSPSVAAAAAADAQSPFVAANESMLDEAAVADVPQRDHSSSMHRSHSVVMLGSTHSKTTQALLTQREQQLLSAAGIIAALLCCLALSSGSTVWLLLAAAVNVLCMWTAVDPSVTRCICSLTVRATAVAARRHQHNFLNQRNASCMHIASTSAAASTSALPAAHLAGLATAGEGAASTGAAAATAATMAANNLIASGGIRIRLLGASFAKEALGLLEEQVNAFKHMQMQAALAAALAASQGKSGVMR